MIRAWLLAAVAAASAHAAAIRGIVVENLTGKPLARAVVVLQPIGETPGTERSLRAGGMGTFEFISLPAGVYVLKASRKGFMPAEYGQKRWNSAGAPVVLADSETPFLSIRLPRYSAIAGTLVDENDIGLPDHEVAAYRLVSPLDLAAHARTNDRGVYRLSGLEPGTYAVRSIAKQYEDGSYLPTFARETTDLAQSRTVDLLPEQQVNEVDVRPIPGRLFILSVATDFSPELPVNITLASEFGRTTVQATEFQFTGLAPGPYDVYAEVANTSPDEGFPAAYQRITLSRDTGATLIAQPGAAVSISGGPAADSGHVWIRRKDLAGVGQAVSLDPGRGRGVVPAGLWEVMLQPPAGYYTSALMASGASRLAAGRADGWNEILARHAGFVRFTLASPPGSLRGVVRSSGDPVGGAPVYLEGWDTHVNQRVGDLRRTWTDTRGSYSFDGLAQGAYRVLSTFDYTAPDVQTMGEAASAVTVDDHAQAARDLDLYTIR